jgi:hypothetical protein
VRGLHPVPEDDLTDPFMKTNSYLLTLLSAACLASVSCEKDKVEIPPGAAAPVKVKAPDEQLQKRIYQLERQLAEANDLATRQATRITELEDHAKATTAREGEALKLAQTAIDQAKAFASRDLPRPTYTPQPAAPVASGSIPQVPVKELPWWIPPSPNTAAREIKAAATAQWKTDYNMVEYEIKKQTADFEKLKKMNATYSKPIKDIIAAAVQKWPGDYNMAVYEAEKQITSLQNLQGR